MNKRIRELAEQSGFFPVPDDTESDWEYRAENARYEKFAQLIVRECLLCCERTISDPVPESVDTFEEGGIHCMDEIKQHFGVEK